jgi:propanol-preferring alcohol dehydrogenase
VRAWAVDRPGPIDEHPLVALDRDAPMAGRGEIRVRVRTCGVCRTDLHLAEGDLSPRRPLVVPGHEIVGAVDAVGDGVRDIRVGDRLGIAWLRSTCGACRYCVDGRENLCTGARFTGWDADGGYAEYAVVNAAYAYRLPDAFDDERAAPLLCAGIVGYRALKLAEVPSGGRLGIYGFGGSAHLTAQVAIATGVEVHVFTRATDAQRLALRLGAASAAGTLDDPPAPLDGAVVFAPAGEIVPAALRAVGRGGTVAVAGIHLSDIPPLTYREHLFEERRLRSVTANTRADGEEFLAVAARADIEVATVGYALDDANRALSDLAHGRFAGAAVLHVTS